MRWTVLCVLMVLAPALIVPVNVTRCACAEVRGSSCCGTQCCCEQNDTSEKTTEGCPGCGVSEERSDEPSGVPSMRADDCSGCVQVTCKIESSPVPRGGFELAGAEWNCPARSIFLIQPQLNDPSRELRPLPPPPRVFTALRI